MVTSYLLLLFLSAVYADTETLKTQVKVGKTKFRCKFTLVNEWGNVVLEKSKVACKPNKPTNKEVENFEVSTGKATYTLSFNINPENITAASIEFKNGETSKPTTGNSYSDLLMKLEDLKDILQVNGKNKECPSSTSAQSTKSENSLMLKQTQMMMMKTQSEFFHNLNLEEKQKYLAAAQEYGDVVLPNHCPLHELIECNDKKKAIEECFDTSVPYSSLSTCLTSRCPGCGVVLSSLLGFDIYDKTITRYISRTNKTSSVFGNILISPCAKKEDKHFKTHMYIDGNGLLKPEIRPAMLSKKLLEHKTYWEAKIGPIKTIRTDVDMATTMIDSADKIVDILDKTKKLVLDDLEDQIKSINVKIDGISSESRKLIEDATVLLYKSTVEVENTRAILENLASDTIERVKSMMYYLSKVRDDWDAEKISRFMKFEAKKMTLLIERSLTLLEDAEQLYTSTSINLAEIQGKLESFRSDLTNLADGKSAAFNERKKQMRIKVYVPCCIFPLACPVCAGILESEIKKWQASLNSLLHVINRNKATVKRLEEGAKEQKEVLGKEIHSLISWGGALHMMSETDWTFEEVEIFGFADVRPDLVNKLDKLKKAAEKYLAINANRN